MGAAAPDLRRSYLTTIATVPDWYRLTSEPALRPVPLTARVGTRPLHWLLTRLERPPSVYLMIADFGRRP